MKTLLVHRKGSTRAFPPHHPLIPADYQFIGQPVLIGGATLLSPGVKTPYRTVPHCCSVEALHCAVLYLMDSVRSSTERSSNGIDSDCLLHDIALPALIARHHGDVLVRTYRHTARHGGVLRKYVPRSWQARTYFICQASSIA